LLEKPPAVDKSLYVFSLSLDFIGIILASLVSAGFALAVVVYGVLSKMYSHPSIRLKKHPIISFLIVFIFQGGFVYWSSYLAMGGLELTKSINSEFVIAGVVCSCLIGASYPLTQVYQHEEDSNRGDRTLSLLLGINGSFLFSAVLFAVGALLMYVYWQRSGDLVNFWMFLLFIIPVLGVFITWILRLRKSRTAANYKNMSKMTLVSGIAMLLYFVCVWIRSLGT
jgi:1,4-dihydroxy-2-naphthoate octaprenyltransferase